jgi:hypothetical protein
MVGLEHDTREEQGTPEPAGASDNTPRGATAIEVAGLRERVDGVSAKLDEVDSRVGALEATQRGDVAPGQHDRPEHPAPSGENSLRGVTRSSGDRRDSQASEPCPGRTDSSTDARPAGVGAATDMRLPVPTAASSSVVLMLSDAQFERWLGSGTSSPPDRAEHEPAKEDGQGDWRLRRSASRPTRSRRG